MGMDLFHNVSIQNEIIYSKQLRIELKFEVNIEIEGTLS